MIVPSDPMTHEVGLVFPHAGKPRTAIEVGAHYLETAVALSSLGCFVHAFECNPAAAAVCAAKMADRPNPRIKFNAAAVTNRELDSMDFLAIDPIRTRTSHVDGNIGASSFFPANPAYPLETYVQTKVQVPSTTIDGYCRINGVEDVDLLWLDAQGSELMILEGATKTLPTIHAVYLEMAYWPVYLGQPLREEVAAFLDDAGFEVKGIYGQSDWFCNELFMRRNPCI